MPPGFLKSFLCQYVYMPPKVIANGVMSLVEYFFVVFHFKNFLGHAVILLIDVVL